ncbi:MAG TPA: NADH:ubiquinone reductase (Na(+)-transporting) subunit C [Kiritimatiellia bacterium]|nr:NADH:ubiquinone reductase (Na(+)-transporting) subunit C [Kiritimatiellia bacterium]HMO98581.1 NADH:ubiquinone reductase (Na(+)-transporting) subunit C [Kiritimatiellia bacterium]HMP95440.1 NADH:ubiquinone reductase (Na(+)-transporting) subunit C [Kiritimatiellia bacterium]
MRKDDIRVITFATIICVVCSLVLSATATILKERQDIAVELDRQMNVLKAFGVAVVDENGRKLTKEAVDRFFTENISEVFIDKATGDIVADPDPNVLKREAKERTHESRTLLPLYVWKEGGEAIKYAFPTSGMGLWSIIHGYVALDRDLSTIIGVTFYKHGETPGLGGEVSADWFQDQFSGKIIFDAGDLVRLEVVKGAAPEGSTHQVDGMSGATMTGNGINQFINRDIAFYEKYFSRIRGT